MRLRYLRIRVNTDKGLHGADIPFEDGLFVLWADNTMGKSTCLNSIIVALGFEDMLTTHRQDLPLPPVMKSELETDAGIARVIESDVYLEVENSTGERIVIHRSIIGERDKNLVSVTRSTIKKCGKSN